MNEGDNDSEKINQNNMQPHGPEVLNEARESGPVIETAIIAVSPIKRLVTAANSTGWFAFEKKDVIFDITVYVPRTRTWYYMSRVVRKPAFCICENKDAYQLRGNREADQRLCFRYTDSTIPLLPKSEISSL